MISEIPRLESTLYDSHRVTASSSDTFESTLITSFRKENTVQDACCWSQPPLGRICLTLSLTLLKQCIRKYEITRLTLLYPNLVNKQPWVHNVNESLW